MRALARTCGAIVVVGALAGVPVAAQDGMPGNAQGDVAVTIYNNG